VTHADRERLHAVMKVLMQHKAQLDYPLHDVRGPKDSETFHLTWAEAKARLAAGGHLMFDCSAAVTCIYKWADCSDPNGLGYRHVGYTGTMLAHLPHYKDAKRCRVGALAVFGPATGEHVACVYQADPVEGNPLLFSHGARGVSGPIRLGQESRFHDPPVTLLDVSSL
jgi:hypothetical protein